MSQELIETNSQPVQSNDMNGPMSFEEANRQFENLKKFIDGQMVKGVDYGTIPGTPKPSLWKAGAEKLRYFNRLGVKMEPTSNTQLDWKNDFFNYEYKAVAYSLKDGITVSEAFGSCNSLEKKFEETISKRGIKAADLANNLSKMAQKRAFVAAILMATRASLYFTQDLKEDKEDSTPVEPKGNNDVISEKQAKFAYAIFKQTGLPDVELRNVLQDILPYTKGEDHKFHISKIKRSDFKNLVDWIQSKIPTSGK